MFLESHSRYELQLLGVDHANEQVSTIQRRTR